MAQAVECLPRKFIELSSSPSTTNKERNKRKEGEREREREMVEKEDDRIYIKILTLLIHSFIHSLRQGLTM
jgi:hypothetical protein